MNTPEDQPTNSAPEELELSQDQELWDFLAKGGESAPNPLFSRNVIREIRLQEDTSASPLSFWQRMSHPKFLIPGSLTGMAVATFLLFNPFSASSNTSTLAQENENESIPEAIASSLENSLETELLLAAADKPDLFTDEEVIAMLF